MAVSAKGVRVLKWVLAFGITVAVMGIVCAVALALLYPRAPGPEVWETLTATDVLKSLCHVAAGVGFMLAVTTGSALIGARIRIARGEPVE